MMPVTVVSADRGSRLFQRSMLLWFKMRMIALLPCPRELWAALDQVQPSESFQPVANAFRINIEATIQVATIPFRLMTVSAVQRRWQAILAAQRIRSLKSDVDETAREEFAQRTATERLTEHINSRIQVGHQN